MALNQINQLALHYYKENIGWTDPNLRFTYVGSSYEVLDGSTVVVEQANQFDAHHIVVSDSELTTILALAGKTRVDIEQIGVGVIAKGVIMSPDQQIRDTGEGEITLDLPNVTEELAWVSTGMGYRDAQEIQRVVANLGALTKFGHSDYDYTKINKFGVPGYDDFGRAITIFTPGRPTGWSATYVDQPGTFQFSTAPVDWSGNVFGGWRYALPNGNTLAADPSHVQVWDGGGIGYPNTFDLTHDMAYAFQVVDVGQSLQSGLGAQAAIGQFAIDFAFYVHGGQWQITEDGAIPAGIGGALVGNSQFTVALNSATGEIFYFVNGAKVYTSHKVPKAPLAPQVVFGSQQAAVTNAIVSKVAPPSQMWWKAAFDDKPQLGAFIQLAQDTDIYVRQAKEGITPLRRMEMGNFGALTAIRLSDGSGGDPVQMARNPNLRVVKTIRQRGPDFANLVNVATPLGGGTGDAQVTVEHLYRIVYDAGYENFGRYKGGFNEQLGNLFPEYDAHYPLFRQPTDAGGYQYYMRSDVSVGQWDEMYGGTPDSTFTYQTDALANKAYVELTERGLYASWIGKFRKNDQPHFLLEVETTWNANTPRAADKVTVDYTGYGFANGVFFNRLRVNDQFYVMKIERTFGPEVFDTWTLSNLGRYMPDPNTAQQNQTARQVAAIQTVTNTALSVSILGTTFRELDAGTNPKAPGDHAIVYPIKILPTCYQVQAAYFRVDFLPFRQTVFETEGGLHHHTFEVIIPDHSHAPQVGLTTDHALIGGMPAHIHETPLFGNKIGTPGPTDLWLNTFLSGGDWKLGMANSNAGGQFIRTNPAMLLIDLNPTTHPHAFTQTATIAATHTFTPISGTTDTVDGITDDAGLHAHTLTPQIQDSNTPVAIQVLIDGGDGNFVNRTAELIDLTQNRAPSATSGFTSSFEFECARFIDAPGRTVRLKFASVGDASNPFGIGALGISGTIAASYGGLGQIVRQQQ